MHPLTASKLLDAWERGLAAPPVARTLPLVAAACDDEPIGAPEALCIGARDRRLLRLRTWTFGARLASVTGCPHCGERLEWTIDASDLDVGDVRPPSADFVVDDDGWHVRFRLPDTGDLRHLEPGGDVDVVRRRLLERCVLELTHDGGTCAIGLLPDRVLDAVVARMDAADPQASVHVDLACPACAHRWAAVFDIEAFFWSELHAWAQRTLHEVHVLASAYGWREDDVLRLTPWRRQAYLGLIDA
jgi:hypothetical protein